MKKLKNNIFFIPLLLYNIVQIICLSHALGKQCTVICKEQVTDEIKRDIWEYLVSSDVADDTWYNYVYNISFCAK